METLAYSHIAQAVYNQLPPQKRATLTEGKISLLLELKESFLGGLTYAQKCALSTHELIGLLYQEVYLIKGFSLPNIEEIIKAEESVSFSFYNDEFNDLFDFGWYEAA